MLIIRLLGGGSGDHLRVPLGPLRLIAELLYHAESGTVQENLGLKDDDGNAATCQGVRDSRTFIYFVVPVHRYCN